MTANAVANYLKKKILLVTVSVMMERDLTKVQLASPHVRALLNKLLCN